MSPVSGLRTQVLGCWLLVAALTAAGCATRALSRPDGIARQAPAHIPRHAPPPQGSYHLVQQGQTLWRIARSYGLDVAAVASTNRIASPAHLQAGQRLFIPLPRETHHFLWPALAPAHASEVSPGIEIAASPGMLARASRGGRVAAATNQLGGWGKTVVLDHADGYLTLYAGLSEVLVEPGAAIRQGSPVGTIGPTGLYFGIRYGDHPRDAAALLPDGS